MFKHILVPTDGSEFSERAVRRAVAFAKEIGAEITAFYAKPDFSAMGYYGEGFLAVAKLDESEDSYAEAYARKVLGFVENLCQEAGVKCQTISVTCALVYEGNILYYPVSLLKMVSVPFYQYEQYQMDLLQIN